jgi:hypothetical protein
MDSRARFFRKRSEGRGTASNNGETERRKITVRRKAIGLVTCVLTLVAVMTPVHAGETSIKAWAAWRGQGRF